MRKISFIELFKSIKHSIIAYVSIVLFLLLGTCLYCGFSWSADSLVLSAQKEITEYKLYDIQICSEYGFSDPEIESIKNFKPNVIVEPTNYSAEICEVNGICANVNVWQTTRTLNQFISVNGTLPSLPNEIAITKDFAESHNIKIGDIVSFKHNFTKSDHLLYSVLNKDKNEAVLEEKESQMRFLNNDTFVVTSLVESVLNISKGGTTNLFSTNNIPVETNFFVNDSAFDKKSTNNYRSLMVYSSEFEPYMYYSDEYKTRCHQLADEYSEFMTSVIAEKRLDILSGIAYLNSFEWETKPNFQELSASSLPFACVTKDYNLGIMCFKVSYDSLEKLKWPLSFVFFFVSFFLTCAVFNRLVSEERKMIGTKKVLGFSFGKIFRNYLLFSLSGTILGVILGVLIGRFLVETIVFNGFMGSLIIAEKIFFVSVPELLIISLSAIAIMVFLTFFTVKKTINTETLSLLNNKNLSKQKKHFYQKGKLWNKLHLVTKTIINNLFTDRRRVIATLVGIISSTGLITCALTFSLNLKNTPKYHYEKIQNYDTVVYYDSGETNDTVEKISYKLNEMDCEYVNVFSKQGFAVLNNENVSVDMYVIDDIKFDSLFNLINEKKEKISIATNGVWLTKAAAVNNNIHDGDELTFILDGTKYNFASIRVAEHYLQSQCIIMNKETYFKYFNPDSFTTNVALIKKGSNTIEDINQSLSGIEGYKLTYDFYTQSINQVNNLSQNFLPMSIVYIVMSIILAFSVILNLLITFVKEKKQELSVLLISGYSSSQVKKYIYFDTIFLTIIGSIIGVALGYLLSYFSLKSISATSFVFLYGFNFVASLIAILSTWLIVFIMTLIAIKPIENYNLSTDLSNV